MNPNLLAESREPQSSTYFSPALTHRIKFYDFENHEPTYTEEENRRNSKRTRNIAQSQNSLFVNAYRNAPFSIFRSFSAIPTNNMIPHGLLLGTMRLPQDLEAE